eukprot:scaffold618_cov130-Cylindrotheca_fusiformis.AAC.42
MTEKESSSSSNNDGGPPSPYAILIIYCVLGCLISFWTGRDPGTLPENIPREMAPAVIVICGFLVSYSTLDVMTVGMSKKQKPIILPSGIKIYHRNYPKRPTWPVVSKPIKSNKCPSLLLDPWVVPCL